ncbi:MAG: hypothetical protein PHY41_03545 [Candidatus Cloacimonetes bacterium]|jgi:hypothetical protein|nr:hypothetical protein [Candidatus Cloacimonadota bacterium]MDY0298978.1 hypothetical protein [Candidatus Cloacimonadaceae bacterium]MCB5278613.1 hypothetical protein [Candidatus Cloacimonadota bacterium]MCK9332003.1 hypothetical protein [Candidatus Cloacimonadota bacterium]MDD2210343.1 hypothetical protein [Candidatus Cloacimonadota bacterium]
MKRLAISILAMILLFGCVHYQEELWLHRDGSGKAKLRLINRSPYENTEEILRKADLPGISLESYNVSRQGPDVIYDIVFKFNNIEAFNNVNDQLGAADFWGKITLNKEHGRRITFKRRIALGSQENDDELESFFSQIQGEYPTWSYKLHVPWKITNSNAAPENVDIKGKTITWNYNTAKMWNNYEYMSAEFRKELPWFVFVIAFISLILIVFVMFWLFRISKKSHLIDRVKHHS